MANYCGYTRTNYFSVTDAEKLADIVDRIAWDDEDDSFFTRDGDRYCFGAYGSICGLKNSNDAEVQDEEDYDPCEDYNCDDVYKALQEIVAPGDAVVITEVGHENLRYLVSNVVVITRDSTENIALERVAIAEARQMLGNPEYTTQNDY